jgi:DNA-directed RNA polymerase beta' subunit
MSFDRQIIRHSVEEVRFGFLSDEEIRSVSVKQITSPMTFDALNNPLPGGLYDPALGPSQLRAVCPTCGQDQQSCPGHIGHIELAAEVYHPLLFHLLYKLLRNKCLSCHRLKLGSRKCRVFAVKMALCDAGEAAKARSLDEDLGAGAAAREANADEGDADLLPSQHQSLDEVSDPGAVQEQARTAAHLNFDEVTRTTCFLQLVVLIFPTHALFTPVSPCACIAHTLKSRS